MVPIENCKLFCELPQEIRNSCASFEIATTKEDGVFEIWCPRDAKKTLDLRNALAELSKDEADSHLTSGNSIVGNEAANKVGRMKSSRLRMIQGKIMDAQGAPFIPEAVGIAEEPAMSVKSFSTRK